MKEDLLRVDHLTKSFGGIRAIDSLTLTLTKSNICGLIGPNGSGKTTLFNLVTGFLKPDEGTVKFDGVDVTGWPAHQVALLCLRRTFQFPRIFTSLTVMENLTFASPRDSNVEASVQPLLEELGLYEERHSLAGRLPFGQRKLLELLRVIVSKPKCVLLDELVTGLTEDERGLVSKEVKKLASAGTKIVIVEHNVEFTMSICEHIYVLDHGCLISEGTPFEISADKKVIDVYLGAS
jgi:ABC-type branched-subunit amino acid transport system ATPase component